jgi:hypothetical protein
MVLAFLQFIADFMKISQNNKKENFIMPFTEWLRSHLLNEHSTGTPETLNDHKSQLLFSLQNGMS